MSDRWKQIDEKVKEIKILSFLAFSFDLCVARSFVFFPSFSCSQITQAPNNDIFIRLILRGVEVKV